MSSHDFFSDDEPEMHICPSCRFKLRLHSAKQVIGCALKEIRLVLGVEKV